MNVFEKTAQTKKPSVSPLTKVGPKGAAAPSPRSPALGFPQSPSPNPPPQPARNPFQRTRKGRWRTGIGLALGGDPNIARAAQQRRELSRFGQVFNSDPDQAIQLAQGAGRFDLARTAQDYRAKQQSQVAAQQQAQRDIAQQQQAQVDARNQQNATSFNDAAVGILTLPPQEQAQAIQFYGQRYGLPPEEIAALSANPNLLLGVAAQSEEYNKALASNAENVTLGAGDRRFAQAGPSAGQEIAYNRDDLGFQNDATDQYGHELDARADHARVAEIRRHNQADEALDADKFVHQVNQDQLSSGNGIGGNIPVALGGQQGFTPEAPNAQASLLHKAAFGDGTANLPAIDSQPEDGTFSPGAQALGPNTNLQYDPRFPDPLARYQSYRASSQANVDVRRLEGYRDDANLARDRRGPALNTLQQLLNNGAKIGPLSDGRVIASHVPLINMIPGLGREDAAKIQAFEATANELVVDLLGNLKGVASDKDTEVIASTVPTHTQSRESAELIIKLHTAVDERTRAKSYLADEWTNRVGGLSLQNGRGETFDQFWENYVNETPLLEELGNPRNDASALSDDELMRQLGQ